MSLISGLPTDKKHIEFYPEEKHRLYWEVFPIPVLVIIYDPSKKIAYWEDVRHILRSPQGQTRKAILIPVHKTLTVENRGLLFETAGGLGQKVLSVEEIYEAMVRVIPTAGFSFLDLFAHGLTDICRSLLFSMGLVKDVTDNRIGLDVDMGNSTYDAVEQYVRFLVAQNLVVYDFSDFLIEWERERVPKFIVPLTSRGRALVKYIQERELYRKTPDEFRPLVARERLHDVRLNPIEYWRMSQTTEFVNSENVRLEARQSHPQSDSAAQGIFS